MEQPPPKRPRVDLDGPQSNSEEPDGPWIFPSSELQGEEDVGITAYVRPTVDGFHCVLKNRWEDFIVREISHGAEAKITSVEPIPQSSEVKDIQYEDAKALEPYMSKLEEVAKDPSLSLKIEAPTNKMQRTLIHEAVRRSFPNLSSATIREGDKSFIIVSRSDSKTGAITRLPKRASAVLPKNLPYCRFVLYKEGKDTINAIQVLSRCLHIQPGMFGYAGTKDRRAITTQFVTVKGIDSKRLSSLNSHLRGLCVGNFSYVSSPLFLGDLNGNRFTVVLRSVRASDQKIRLAVESWKQNGFINYYGLQRFGHSKKSKSYEIGRHLILGNWAEAIDLILAPTSADLPQVRKAKEHFATSDDAVESSSIIPPCAEKSLLQGVAKHGKILNALHSLPRNLRQLYAHSYQSLIWNRVASRRVTELGIDGECAHTGDLFILNAGAVVQDSNADEGCPDPCSQSAELSCCESLPNPEVASESDAKSISVTDVVLPLPGFAVRYPENESGRYYTELLKEDGLTMEDFRHRVKDFSLPGTYRTLIVKPENVTYELRSYTDANVPLVRSDIEELKMPGSRSQQTGSSLATDKETGNNSPEHTERALILSFTLPKSSYATIAIRELTKSAVERR